METEREYLKAAFGGLLEDVRDILEQSLRDGPVRFAPGLSLPGFHYIYSHAAWQFPVFNMREISREQPRRQSWPRLAEMSRGVRLFDGRGSTSPLYGGRLFPRGACRCL